jgi:hypothetical protein
MIMKYPLMNNRIPARGLRNNLSRASQEDDSSFKEFSASELYCAKCKRANPVREKLLLCLPSGNMYDYICSVCGSSVGTKK